MSWYKILSIIIPILVALSGVGYASLESRLSACEADTRNIYEKVTDNGKGIAKIVGYLGLD